MTIALYFIGLIHAVIVFITLVATKSFLWTILVLLGGVSQILLVNYAVSRYRQRQEAPETKNRNAFSASDELSSIKKYIKENNNENKGNNERNTADYNTGA